MYEKYIKRILDFIISLVALIILGPLFIILIVIGCLAMKGNPFFCQKRPGKDEKIFCLIKFRTMTNEKDKDGNLLSDEKRLNGYGRFLRSSSLDELPELFNVLIGQMSLVGPRPQLVRDMVFMSQQQRKRHSVRQGLTGLAQINGRNNMLWEEKLEYDLEYIKNITFLRDLRIVFLTIGKVFKREGITEEGNATAQDFGDYLLSNNKIDLNYYQRKQQEARALMRK